MKRRSFLLNTGALAATTALGCGTFATAQRGPTAAGQPSAETSANKAQRLRFFIISDAHFGWRHETCPTNDEFRSGIRQILARFPDLDFFVDSGDAHHSYAEPQHIEDWTEIVQSELGGIPLHFVSGNHEIDSWNRDWDPEEHAARIASLPARPYYSFDMKGIHFLVLPQMIMMSYVSAEALAWARLDLALNRGKTTIILSHNSLKGTTGFQTDLGYRQTVNSDEVLEFIREHPQIVAWMHGHNHTYELVPVEGVAYVSNGRFGGFNPEPLPDVVAPNHQSPSNNNIGGFFVEITRRSVMIRAFNLSLEKWFDELPGHEFLRWERELGTSLDPRAEPAISYGHGRMHHGALSKLTSHYAAAGVQRQVHLSGAPDEIINENSDFRHYTQRTLPDWQSKHLPGFLIRPLEETEIKNDPTWHWLNPGIRLDAKELANQPKMIVCPGPGPGRRSYFRCVPGTTYEVTLEIDAGPGGQQFALFAEVCSQEKREAVLQLTGIDRPLEAGNQIYRADFAVPRELAKSSLHGGGSDLFQLNTTARFTRLNDPVVVKRFELRIKGARGRTVAPTISVGKAEFGLSTSLTAGQVASFTLGPNQEPQSLLSAEAKGNGQLCVLIREEGRLWQVRNAAAVWQRGALAIGPITNPFTRNKEVVVAPCFATRDPRVTRVRNATKFTLNPFRRGTNQIVVEIAEATGGVEIDLHCDKAPTAITNGELVKHEGGTALVRASGTGTLTIAFA